MEGGIGSIVRSKGARPILVPLVSSFIQSVPSRWGATRLLDTTAARARKVSVPIDRLRCKVAADHLPDFVRTTCTLSYGYGRDRVPSHAGAMLR